MTTMEYGPGPLDPERLAAFNREAEGVKRLANAVFHDAPDGVPGYRSIHLMRHLITAHEIVALARHLTKCLRPKRDRLLPGRLPERCRKCHGCALDTQLRILDDSEKDRADFDAKLAAIRAERP